MAYNVENPRYPHTCKIYRPSLTDELNEDGTEKVDVLYEGVCQKQSATTMRTYKTSNVIKGDYAVYLPGLVSGITSGDMIDVTDFIGTTEGNIVSDTYPTHLGTTLYFNIPKN